MSPNCGLVAFEQYLAGVESCLARLVLCLVLALGGLQFQIRNLGFPQDELKGQSSGRLGGRL